MDDDLSRYHLPVGGLFPRPEKPNRFLLTTEQLAFFEANGYVAGIRMLNDEPVEALRKELAELIDPSHSGHHLFYEFHSNESGDPEKVLFHALGAWRIKPGLHDILWHQAFTVPATQLLGGPIRFWHDQIFYKPAHHGGVV